MPIHFPEVPASADAPERPGAERRKVTKERLETAWAIAEAWGHFCADDEFLGQIRDVEELPFPRTAIWNSILTVAGAERDPEIVEALQVVSHPLAYFQPDVGTVALWSTGCDRRAILALYDAGKAAAADADGMTYARAMVADLENKRRYEQHIGQVRRDAARLRTEIDRIIRTPVRRP